MMSLFMIVFPTTELLFLNDLVENKIDLTLFILSQCTALMIALFFARELGLLNYNNNDIEAVQRGTNLTNDIAFLVLTIFFFSVFIVFVLKHIPSLAHVVFFAEEYRNGYYSGSGIYTAGMTQVVPFFIAVMLIKNEKLDLFFYLILILALITSYILGLRIYLLSICFFLIIRVCISEHRLRALLVMFALCAFLISFKLFLNESVRESSLSEILLHTAGRVAHRFLVYDSGFGFNLDNISAILPFFNEFTSCNVECFKEGLVTQLPNISTNMPFIHNYTGVAIPLPLLLFNVFGYFGWVFTVLFVILFLFFLKKAYCSSNLFINFLSIMLSFYLFAVLIEDITYFLKINYAIVIAICGYLLINLSRLRVK
jgi:hypothetical protein